MGGERLKKVGGTDEPVGGKHTREEKGKERRTKWGKKKKKKDRVRKVEVAVWVIVAVWVRGFFRG